jgi:hypothetical protein
MGLNIELQNERGECFSEVVTDPNDLLHRMLPPPDDESFCVLRFIDWYGDTTFNRFQCEVFLVEWDRLSPLGDSPAVREESVKLLKSIRELAERALKEPHQYLKFIGD